LDIVCWNEEGDGFQIKKQKLFEDQILPLYFNGIIFNSFLRQLNMYHFDYLKEDKTSFKLFKNANFLKGRRDLLRCIPHRTKENRRRAKELKK
jgi:heat shock transcription factor